MDRNNIDKIAHNPEDRLLLARLWDKIQPGICRSIPAHTDFLSLREQELARLLFGDVPGLHYFGGHADAERKMLVYLPEYCTDDALTDEDGPIVCLEATFHRTEAPTHRDFLGALVGCGIRRGCIGDICVGEESCDFFVTREIAPFLLEAFESAGRVRLKLSEIPLSDARIPIPEFAEIRDTVSTLRLDSIVASGFRISRSLAADAIHAGKAAVDGLPCEKPDKVLRQGMKISLRGYGKIKLETVGGLTKKGRISVIIHRYI